MATEVAPKLRHFLDPGRPSGVPAAARHLGKGAQNLGQIVASRKPADAVVELAMG